MHHWWFATSEKFQAFFGVLGCVCSLWLFKYPSDKAESSGKNCLDGFLLMNLERFLKGCYFGYWISQDSRDAN